MLLVLMGCVGVLATYDLVWMDRLLNHPYVYGVLAALLFGVGLAFFMPRKWLRFLTIAACVAIAGLWALYGLFWSYIDGVEEQATVAAPPGRGADYQVVVTQGTDVIDPIWFVTIRQRNSWLAREWQVGCLSGDDGRDSFAWTKWDSRSRLVIRTESRSVTVRINPRTGEPRAVTGNPWNRCSN